MLPDLILFLLIILKMIMFYDFNNFFFKNFRANYIIYNIK